MKRRRILGALVALAAATMATAVSGLNAGAATSIANPSVEDGGGAKPPGWSLYAWPQTASVFVWAAEGHDGSRSLRIDMTTRTIGDAKWWTDPVDVRAGVPYRYTHWYRSDTSPQVMVEFRTAAGAASYLTLASLGAQPTGWTLSSLSFTPPAGTARVSMFHILPNVGFLMVDDVALDLAPPPPPTTTTTTTMAPPPQPGDELVPNGSFEAVGSNGRPNGWIPIRSGANVMMLPSPAGGGHTGARYGRVEASEYTDGTAKWYFPPVAITTDTPYRMSHWYRATAASELMVEFRRANGTSSYRWLGEVPPAANWTQLSRTLTPPADTTAMAFWQGSTGVGALDVDDVSLRSDLPPPPPPPPPLLANGSFESAAGANPQGWIPIKAGLNVSALSYPATGGHSGNRYVRAEITRYTNGDAKWYFPPVPVTPGQTYRLTNWQRSDSDTEWMVEFALTNGTSTYTWLGEVTPSPAVWEKHTVAVTAPPNAVAISFWHGLRGIGYLDTDDYSMVVENVTSFTRPLVSLTFDDGFATNATIVAPKLQQYAMTGTFYIASGLLGNPGYLNASQLPALDAAGLEIGAHTVTHADLVPLAPAQRVAELETSRSALEAIIGKPVTAFATPFGSFDPPTLIDIRARFGSHRTTNEGYNTRSQIDPYLIKRRGVFSTTTAADVAQWCAEAKAQGAWLVLIYHELSANPGFYSTTPARFEEQLQALSACGIHSTTVSQALTELLPQIP